MMPQPEAADSERTAWRTNMTAIEVGTTARLVCTVGPEHLASGLATEPGESYPSVFSTPWLLAQFEKAPNA
jgi:fluoroacetyl-CoA thioesterase